MTMTTREVFERGTDTFNAHDIDGFAELLTDDVAFQAPGGMRGQGKPACVEFYGSWLSALQDAHVEVHDVYFLYDVAVEEGTFSGTHNGVLRTPTGDIPPTGRAVSLDYIQVLRFRYGNHVSFDLMFDRLLMLEQLGLIPVPACALTDNDTGATVSRPERNQTRVSLAITKSFLLAPRSCRRVRRNELRAVARCESRSRPHARTEYNGGWHGQAKDG